jgi:hypothetical protein
VAGAEVVAVEPRTQGSAVLLPAPGMRRQTKLMLRRRRTRLARPGDTSWMKAPLLQECLAVAGAKSPAVAGEAPRAARHRPAATAITASVAGARPPLVRCFLWRATVPTRHRNHCGSGGFPIAPATGEISYNIPIVGTAG